MRVLIVGCGYVGLPLGVELVRQGHEVFGLRRTGVAEAGLREPATETSRVLLEAEPVLVTGSLPAIILRVAGIYGPGRGYWLEQYLRGEATLSRQGERIVNMIHRDDVVGAIIAAL